ncbi:MAG: sporulation protein YabP [Clostridium sp.]|uniref:sporulation protein YabP n=1 Tax=Clostridium sp. TaxID=1506 RepID=UPI003F4123B9
MNKDNNSIKLQSMIEVENRRKMSLTGVNEVLSFNEEKIILNTVLGKMNIKGQGLKVNKLDVKNGDVIVEGFISSIVYTNNKNKATKRKLISILKRRKV